jgi:hypothetical protein
MELLNDDEQTDFSEKQAYDRLMDGKDIRWKTEVTDEQRCIIPSIETSIKHFEKKGIKLYVAQNFVLSFIDMGASIDRKSRKETVEALKAKLDFLEKNQLMDKQSNIIR